MYDSIAEEEEVGVLIHPPEAVQICLQLQSVLRTQSQLR